MKFKTTTGKYKIVNMRPETLRLVKAIYSNKVKKVGKKLAMKKVDIIHDAIYAAYKKEFNAF